MFEEIIAALGEEVAIADVKANFPNMVGHVMRRCERTGRGRYKLVAGAVPVARKTESASDSDLTVELPAVAMTVHKREIDVIDNIGDENLIPSRDPKYVPWGCFTIVQKVIKSPVFAPVYIIGDSGIGKTLGVEQACARERRELVVMNITNETSEEDLIGSYILKNGDMVWKDGPVIVAMRRGAVLCLDEIDQARPAILALQTVAQGKPYFIKKTNELVHPKPGFVLVGTANTKGDGASDQFAGAQVLNQAFMDRFPIVIEQDYPTEAIEKKILQLHSDNDQLVSRLARFAKITRSAYNDGGVAFCLTTRRLVQICQNIQIFGNERQGVELALSRFNSETKNMFVELYDKMVKEDREAEEKAKSTPAQFKPKGDLTTSVQDPF